MKASEMTIGVWYSEAPEFDMECVFITASLIGGRYEYSVWEVKKLDGENDEEESCWYYGLLTGDGIEWGDINDLSADKYLILPKH